ncbi:MAG: hypothetical protein M1819_007216 [Sarea resinae]|nr:MAG: hypothetical protein M1819_007216 [Sarea resinae]
MDAYWAAPPITRTLTAATVLTSVLVHTRLLNWTYVMFYLPYLFKLPPQLWRCVTSFLVTGGGLGILFDSYFLYTYGSSLETQSSRFSNPADYVTYLVFIWFFILTSAGFVLGGFFFVSALTLALAYTHSQENRNQKVGFFFFTIPAPWLPYAMLGMTLVMAGPEAALHQGTGLLAAHLYDFLTRLYPTFGDGENFIRAPQFVERWFNHPGPRARPYGTAFTPRTEPSRGSSSGFSGLGSWGGRGAGRRLGGD